MRPRQGCEFTCQNCRHDISEEDLPKFCPYLSKYVKCQNCVDFQAFAQAAREKVETLRHLTPEERAVIVDAPDFYKFDQPNNLISQSQTPAEWDFPTQSNGGNVDSVHLSLFEDAAKPQPNENPEQPKST